ncbi:glycosyltransferase family 2 protein [Bacillus sp. H8-1]|nr:glycosyltransferase family 2 protein [Bacillus sp. H8-1]
MQVEMLVSTMNQKDSSLLAKMNISGKSTVINQITDEKIQAFKDINEEEIKFISLKDRGLSKSRNMALNNATAEICVVCDDDMEYPTDYERIILKHYIDNPDVDIIIFQVQKEDGSFYKKYKNKKRMLNLLSIMKVSSVEITFRRESIIKAGIKYNELFGAGSKFFMGEESIFLSQCIKAGLKVLYVPEIIGKLSDSESTWFRGYDKEYFMVKGACFYAMGPKFYFILILQFAMRKHKFYKETVSLLNAINFMIKGKKEYKRLASGELK